MAFKEKKTIFALSLFVERDADQRPDKDLKQSH